MPQVSHGIPRWPSRTGAAALNLEEYKGATGSPILGYIEHETQLFQNFKTRTIETA